MNKIYLKYKIYSKIFGNVLFTFFLLSLLLVAKNKLDKTNEQKRYKSDVNLAYGYHVPNLHFEGNSSIHGRPVSEIDLSNIQHSYLEAWFYLNRAFAQKSVDGLEHYFSKELVKGFKNNLHSNNDIKEIRIDLEHNIEPYLFSLDKQIFAFKDKNVRIKKKVYDKNKLIYKEDLRVTFEVAMVYEDDRWKILQFKKLKTSQNVDGNILNEEAEDNFLVDKVIESSEPIVACDDEAKDGFHKVSKGETLFSIAKKYKKSIADLKKWNKNIYKHSLKVCSHIKIEDNSRNSVVLMLPTLGAKKSTIENVEVFEENLSQIDRIKGINYYPSSSPWMKFWREFDLDSIDSDLVEIQHLGFNTVRLFIPSDGVVQDLKFDELLERLDLLLNQLSKYDLQAIITLFDFPVSYELDSYPKAEIQLKGLLAKFKTNENILAWDLKNEADLDFEQHGKDKVLDWLEYMIERAKVYDANHPLTVGWSIPKHSLLLEDKLDFLSFHYYGKIENFKKQLDSLQNKTTKKLLLSEFGMPSYNLFDPLRTSQSKQKSYINEMITFSESEKLPVMLWTFNDFEEVPYKVFGYKKWIFHKQKYFGLKDKVGTPKESYKLFRDKH